MVERSGKDLREVGLLVGSGGVLRHHADRAADVLLRHLDAQAGWQLPEAPRRWWTPTTCSRRPACSRPTTPQRRTPFCRPSADGPHS